MRQPLLDSYQKLNVGCGNDIRAGWINLDVAELQGVDVVHDLAKLPWPFQDSQFSEIVMINVLEHISDTIPTLEELHRISSPGCKLTIRVPYWNSPSMFTDPTHKSFFNEYTFDFFDPSKRHCKERPYYSTARFRIARIWYYTKVILPFIKIGNRFVKSLMSFFAQYLGAIIWAVEFELIVLKGNSTPQ